MGVVPVTAASFFAVVHEGLFFPERIMETIAVLIFALLAISVWVIFMVKELNHGKLLVKHYFTLIKYIFIDRYLTLG